MKLSRFTDSQIISWRSKFGGMARHSHKACLPSLQHQPDLLLSSKAIG
jgi:hypothetical protein